MAATSAARFEQVYCAPGELDPSCPNPDDAGPSITIEPAGGGPYSAPTDVSVTIKFCDNGSVDWPTRHIWLDSIDVTGSFTAAGGYAGTGTCREYWQATGIIHVGVQTRWLSASVKDAWGNSGVGSAAFITPNFASITNPSTTPASSTSGSATSMIFEYTQALYGGSWVQIGTFTAPHATVAVGDMVAMSLTATDTVGLNGYIYWEAYRPDGSVVSPAWTTPATGTSVNASTTFVPTSPGRWSVHAHAGNSNGNYRAVIMYLDALDVPPLQAIATAGPGQERDLCLTIAAGAGAAYECGDLRLTHPLPTARANGKTYTPTLLYNSQAAHPYPLVASNVRVTGSVPSTVTAQLYINNEPTPRATSTWSGSDWAANSTRHITIGFDAVNDATGSYPYRLRVTTNSGDSLLTVLGRVLIVNRNVYGFIRGWSVAGIDRLLHLTDGTKLFIGGDGSTRLYSPVAGRIDLWTAPQLDRQDWITHEGTTYVQHLPHGLRVIFDEFGNHIKTRNRLGDETVMTWTGTLLQTIAIPHGPSYQFTYDGGWLQNVQQLVGGTVVRTTSVSFDDAQTLRLTDPDGKGVLFWYNPAVTNRIERRINRVGDTTSYAYDAAYKLQSTRIGMRTQPALVTAYTAAESRGVAAIGPALDSAQVYTTVNGPRTDTTVTRFWVDRFGAPVKIQDALNQITTVMRGDARWPALVTRSVAANGRVLGATYDAFGNIRTSTDSSTYRGTTYATTRYEFDQFWGEVTKIVNPENDSTLFSYDLANGNRLSQAPGGDAARTIQFSYGNAAQRLSSVQYPASDGNPLARDSVDYDPATWNVVGTRTPKGYWTVYGRDLLGRVTQTSTPIDSSDKLPGTGSSIRQTTQTRYDVLDRVDSTYAIGPLLNGVGPDTLIVANFYNAEGWLDSLTRRSGPDRTGVGTLRTSFVYDAMGRKVKEFGAEALSDTTIADRYTYDAAGNVIRMLTRRQLTIALEYDPLNRLRKRTTPAVTYGALSEQIASLTMLTATPSPAPPYGGLTIARDSAIFAYDEVGNVTLANNADAQVGRTYYPNGLLQTETQRLRTYTPTGTSADTLTHVYQVQYAYDLNGRRVTLRHPAQLAPSTASAVRDSVHYSYDPLTGELAAVRDPLGKVFTFGYGNRGEQLTLALPGGITERRQYDDDGQLVLHQVENGSSSPPLRRSDFRYDGRGKLVRAANAAALVDTLRPAYSGLGHLTQSNYASHGMNVYGNPARLFSEETYGYDAFGNAYTGQDYSNLRVDRGFTTTTAPRSAVFAPLTGRVSLSGHGLSKDRFRYDSAGNTTFMYTDASASGYNAARENRASFYAADGKLRVADYRWTQPTDAAVSNWWWRRVYEEFRYDALGRRVLVRTRRDCWVGQGSVAGGCRFSTIRRTVWDGDAELYEIQMPGDSLSTALFENDTTPVQRPYQIQVGFDVNPQFGRVAYTYGHGLDQPLSITRINYVDQPAPSQNNPVSVWAPFAIMPLWNYRGEADRGTFDDGGLTTCRTVGSAQRCVAVDWPLGAFAYGWEPRPLISWQGTLTEQKQDGTGPLYRRARYVDPATGRFTQEDPIGLAGGMNLYGFAAGDPVSYSDPFGLCPNPLALGLGSLQCALEDVISAVKDTPHQLFQFGKVALTNPVASAVIFGALGEVGGAAQGFTRLAGPAREGTQVVLQEFFGQAAAGAERRLASRTLTPGITREMLTWYRDVVARPIMEGVAAASKQTAKALETQAARLKLIDEALRNWPQ